METAPTILPQDCWYAVARCLPYDDLRRLRSVSRALNAVAIHEDARRGPLNHIVAESKLIECAPVYTRQMDVGATIGGARYETCSDVFLGPSTQQPWFVAGLRDRDGYKWQHFALNASCKRFEPKDLPHVSRALQGISGELPKPSCMVGSDHLCVIAQPSEPGWAQLHILDVHQDRPLCTISLNPQSLEAVVPIDPLSDRGPMAVRFLRHLGSLADDLVVANLVHSVENPYLSLTLQDGRTQLDLALDYEQGKVLSVLPSCTLPESAELSGFHLLDAHRSYLPSFQDSDFLPLRRHTWLSFSFDQPGVRPCYDDHHLSMAYNDLVGQNGRDTIYLQGRALAKPQQDSCAVFALKLDLSGASEVSSTPLFRGMRTRPEQVFGLMNGHVMVAPDWRDWLDQRPGYVISSPLLRPYPLRPLGEMRRGSRRTTYLSQEGDVRPRRMTEAQYLLTKNPSLAPFVVVPRTPPMTRNIDDRVLLRLAAPDFPVR